MSKRTIILGLIGLNLILLAGLVLSSYTPPAAYAQGRGRPGDYMSASAQIHEDYDAVSVINVQRALMFTFVPDSRNKTVLYVGGRDLNRDFER